LDILCALIARFGNGVTEGRFRVPGEFGKEVPVTHENTTLYAGDRDMFVFLADEQNRIEIPNRRSGKSGSLARGFFLWNSEVGASSIGLGTFLFDYTCFNRIVWGAEQYKEIRIDHYESAPGRWIGELMPALTRYANSSAEPVARAITQAQATRLDDSAAFLTEQFGKHMAARAAEVHFAEEGRPVETLWDAITAVTALARTIRNQDNRVSAERHAGALLDLAA
jgi:hypothetical protein